jgi:hypothetical protein
VKSVLDQLCAVDAFVFVAVAFPLAMTDHGHENKLLWVGSGPAPLVGSALERMQGVAESYTAEKAKLAVPPLSQPFPPLVSSLMQRRTDYITSRREALIKVCLLLSIKKREG